MEARPVASGGTGSANGGKSGQVNSIEVECVPVMAMSVIIIVMEQMANAFLVLLY